MIVWLWFAPILLCHLIDCCQFENGSMIYSAGGRYSTNLTECLYPSSEQEIIDLINMAQRTNSSIRATGKSHSKSAVNMMEENTQIEQQLFMINMSVNMKNIIELNINENFMTFEAGLSTLEVFEYLEIYNLTLPNWTGAMQSNFVGNIMTGSHGMGTVKNPVRLGATNVIHLRMVTSNGTVIEANNTLNKDIFDSVRVSFGALGIITQITVRTVPIFYGTRHSETYIDGVDNMEFVTEIIENEVSYHQTNFDICHNRYFFFEHQIRITNKVIYITNGSNQTELTDTKCWDSDTSRSVYVDSVDSMVCTDVYYKALLTNPPPETSWHPTFALSLPIEYEMFVDAALWKETLLGVFGWIFTQKNEKTDLWMETERFYNESENDGDITMDWRFVGMDEIWLSPSYNGDVFQIGMHFHGANSLYIMDKWILAIGGYLQHNFGPVTYHWGKQSLSKYCDLQESYAKLQDFKKLRDELDPNGIFLNKFIRDKLGLCGMEEMMDCCCTNSTCKSYGYDGESDDDYLMIIAIAGCIIVAIVGFILLLYWYKKRCGSGKKEKLQQQDNTNYEAIEQATF